MPKLIKPQYGGLTRVYFGILSAQQELADPVVPPSDALVTLSSAANANATSLAFAALAAPVSRGNLLRFFPAAQVQEISAGASAAKNAITITVTALAADVPKGSRLLSLNKEFEIVVTAAAATGATSISVEPLKEAIASGDDLYLFSGTPKFAYTTSDAEINATSINVRPLDETIASGSIALHQGMILLTGGTSTGESLNTDSEQKYVFGNGRGYSVSSATGAGWEMPYEALCLDFDSGFYRLKYAASRAIDGVLGYVRKRDPAPNGYVYGETTEGICSVYGYEKQNPADGDVTFSTTFTGQLDPINEPPAL